MDAVTDEQVAASGPAAVVVPAHAAQDPDICERPRAGGKFLFAGARKLWVRGVTYGTFQPGPSGDDYPVDELLERDFALMASNAINTVRCYTVPPRRLLDVAQRHGLRVMVGLPWEQHIAFLDEPGRAQDILRRVSAGVRVCARHPAVLCYAVGNEIPASIVRWHGPRKIERFIERLYRAAKAEDPGALVTYVNFPTTEYLRLPFLDLCCFNVYLESRERLEAYLARLQSLAGERPLLLAEIGLDSRRNGLQAQSESLDRQLRTAFASGCAGAFAFAWTDQWHRGGHDIEDWDFGLTTHERRPKPALAAVRRAFSEVPFPPRTKWPRVTVVVCSFNGARTIRDTLAGLERLEYPEFEVIVVNDGSTDATPRIAAQYGVRLISTENRGLSNARNTGWQAATGQIVAYIDDDAYPDPHWLHYLAYRFMTSDCVAVGGPNIAPPGDGPIADCVANAPGGPVHVLLSDTEAEHIPGCNMAFRREALAAVGGFDPRYRVAGDDVDVCWRLQQRGGKIGFHAAAMDWHHRRNSLAMYWRQQKGYGKAEALLEEKWPERYNAAGHLAWAGRLYGRGITLPISFGSRVYGGVWGSAAYQSLYEPAPLTLLSLPLMPEWIFVVASLAAISLLGLSWPPLLAAVPLLVLALAAPVAQAGFAAMRARFPVPARGFAEQTQRWALTFGMHLMQPAARLIGRIKHGLTPWRLRGTGRMSTPWPRHDCIWSEHWRSPEDWIAAMESALRAGGAVALRGSYFDRWDLEVRGGLWGGVRSLVAVEEHGAGRQMARLRAWPRMPGPLLVLIGSFGTLACLALADSAWIAGGTLACIAGLLAVFALRACARAAASWGCAVDRLRDC